MGSKPKTLQVDYDLFIMMVSYIASHVDPYDTSIRQIIDGAAEKLGAMQKRDYFTLFKTGKTPSDHEDHVREYQDLLNRLESLHL